MSRLADNLPGAPETPDLWLLGSSEQSAYWAGELGLPYSYADFIHPHSGAIAEIYREAFQPSARLAAPEVSIGVRALVADTEEEAERLSSSWRMAFDLLRQGRPSPVPPPEKAARYLELHADGLVGPARAVGQMAGTAEKVRAEIEETAAAYGAEEVIVVTITHDHAARRRSYELLAEAFELQPRPIPGVRVGA
jgi:luciferase family oxidoreductase group 1